MRAPVRHAVLAFVLGTSLGCGSREQVADPSATARQDVNLEEDATPKQVLAALRQSHATVRDRLGPHRLRYTLETSLTPPKDGSYHSIGPGVPQPDVVRDELDLLWASVDPREPTLQLDQHNDHGRGRSVVISGERIYTQELPRGWHVARLETDIYESWLDDAQRAAGDAFELVAPSVLLAGEREGDDPPLLTFTLSLASEVDRSLIADRKPAAWRKDITFDAIEGSVAIEPDSGAWRSLDLTAQYRIAGTDGPIVGRLRFQGTVERLDPDRAAVTPPKDATPIPQRVRYEPERRALLDGLAGP